MPLWGNSKGTTSDKPKFLYAGSQTTDSNGLDHPKDADLKTNCVGYVGSDLSGNRSRGGQGWTAPAGGNDNASAKREVLVAMKGMTA